MEAAGQEPVFVVRADDHRDRQPHVVWSGIDRRIAGRCNGAAAAARRQCEVLSSGFSRMYQLSQSVREPPASVTVNERFSDGTSQWRFARPDSSATRYGLRRLSGESWVAVGVLHAGENPELAPRPHVDLELADAVDHVVVDALGVLPVPIAARLPVAFEDVARVGRIRRELPRCRRHGRERPHQRTHTGEEPG
jgi:hypothetical protein